jgi:hypothetical protein
MYVYNEYAARVIHEDRSRSLRKDAEQYRLARWLRRAKKRGGRYASPKAAARPTAGVASGSVPGRAPMTPGVGV